MNGRIVKIILLVSGAGLAVGAGLTLAKKVGVKVPIFHKEPEVKVDIKFEEASIPTIVIDGEDDESSEVPL